MRIGIFVDNKAFEDVPCEDVLNGNPGIGGTEYCFLFLATNLKQKYPDDEIILFTSSKGKLPRVDITFISDFESLPKNAHLAKVDILLVSSLYKGNELPRSFFDTCNFLSLKIIVWSHNFYLSDFCTLLSSSSCVKANVFVGRQQYDRYIDHKVIRKSTFIYNMYATSRKMERNQTENIVTYIGSLIPAKGFHVLAASWKRILAKVPDASLYVIGSGKLYDRTTKLGKFGLAEEQYEKTFVNKLLDENGEILPSVHFLGVLGTEKNEVISKTSVGVVNPTGKTETFGISALDFESMGVPVVTIAKGGFLDTVVNRKTGLLYKRKNKLAENIILLLVDKKMNNRFGNGAFNFCERFKPESIINKWHDLFDKVCANESIEYIKPDSFLNNNFKRIRIINRKIKNFLHLEYPFSIIGLETIVKKMLRRVRL